MKVLSSTISSKHLIVRRVMAVIIFLICFFMIDLLIGLTCDKLYGRIYTGPGRYNYFKANRFDCLIMGSSRATYYYADILSRKTERTFLNVGLDGSALVYSRALIDYIVQHGAAPKFVILNIDLFEFQMNAWSGNYYAMIESLMPLYGQNDYIDNALLEKGRWEWVKFQIRSYKYNDNILSILKKNIRVDDVYTHVKSPKTVMQLPIEEAIFREKYLQPYHVDPQKIDLLEDFIHFCRLNQIRPILVISPKFYPNGEITATDRALEKMVSRTAAQLKVDLLKITAETHPEFKQISLYKDILHLNHTGSILFSNIFSGMIAPEINDQ